MLPLTCGPHIPYRFAHVARRRAHVSETPGKSSKPSGWASSHLLSSRSPPPPPRSWTRNPTASAAMAWLGTDTAGDVTPAHLRGPRLRPSGRPSWSAPPRPPGAPGRAYVSPGRGACISGVWRPYGRARSLSSCVARWFREEALGAFVAIAAIAGQIRRPGSLIDGISLLQSVAEGKFQIKNLCLNSPCFRCGGLD